MKLTSDNLAYLSLCAVTAAKQAGELIAGYADKNVEVLTKEGGDTLASQVVTEADLRSEEIIVEVLQPAIKKFDLGLLTEERADDASRLDKDYFWCIDPIDGTLSFIEGAPGYAVSIALVSKTGVAQIGVVFDPLSTTLNSAIKGQGALRNGEPWTLSSSSALVGKPLTLVIDRSLEAQPFYPGLLEQFESIARKMKATGLETLHKGGAVMNGCRVLENPPGCYFKFTNPQAGGGSLLDFAAITCLFDELGAIATHFDGEHLQLKKTESTFINKHNELNTTHPSLLAEIQGLDLKA